MATKAEIARVATNPELPVQVRRITTYLAASGTGAGKLAKLADVLPKNQGAPIPELSAMLSKVGVPDSTIAKMKEYIEKENQVGHDEAVRELLSESGLRFLENMRKKGGLDDTPPGETFQKAVKKQVEAQAEEYAETGQVTVPE